MAAGLKAYNANGNLLIDSQYRNMVLVAKGTIALSGQISGTALCYADIPLTSGLPVLAWISSFPVSNVYSANGAFRVVAELEYQNQQITYYIFDFPSLIAPSALGFKVWNPAGVLVFDSGMKWLKIRNISNTGGSTATGSFQAPAGLTYATMLCTYASAIRFSQFGGADGLGNATFIVDGEATGVYPTAQGMTWAPIRTYRGLQIRATATPPPQGAGVSPGSVALVDVTGY